MFERVKRKIEGERYSESILWRSAVAGKDAAYRAAMHLSRQLGGMRHFLYAKGAFSTERYELPDFLGIGARRSATTWLDNVLRLHPGLFLPSERKEVRFFDSHFHRSLAWYSRFFEAGRGKLKGELSPDYLTLSPRIIGKIRELIPRVRLFVILRNPITRAWSDALMHFTLVKKIAAEEVPLEALCKRLMSKSFRLRGDYPRCLENWLGFFPEEQIFIGYYEDVLKRPKELLQSIFSHLGTSSAEFVWGKAHLRSKVNAAKKVTMRKEHYDLLYELHAEHIKDLFKQLGNPIIKEWLREKPYQSS